MHGRVHAPTSTCICTYIDVHMYTISSSRISSYRDPLGPIPCRRGVRIDFGHSTSDFSGVMRQEYAFATMLSLKVRRCACCVWHSMNDGCRHSFSAPNSASPGGYYPRRPSSFRGSSKDSATTRERRCFRLMRRALSFAEEDANDEPNSMEANLSTVTKKSFPYILLMHMSPLPQHIMTTWGLTIAPEDEYTCARCKWTAKALRAALGEC